MKSFIKYSIITLIAALFTASVFAAEGDYGYYDRNEDGKIGAIDVIMIVKELVNSDNPENTLLKALKTLKISTSAETVTAAIKSMDYVNKAATVFYKDNEVTMSFAQLGLDKVNYIDLYEEGLITMTVPSPAKDFFAKFDIKNVYGAKVNYRYDTVVFECALDSTEASLDGNSVTLSLEPVAADGNIMVGADIFSDYFEAEVAETEYVSANTAAESLGMKFAFDEESGKITLIRQFYPTIILDEASCTTGGEVMVNVTVKHNPGFAGLEYRINYDSDIMSYVKGKANTSSFFSQFSPSEGANPVKAVLANLSLKNVSGDLSLATITFKIADNAAPGEYPLTFSNFQCYDADIINIKMVAENGTIVIE